MMYMSVIMFNQDPLLAFKFLVNVIVLAYCGVTSDLRRDVLDDIGSRFHSQHTP